MPPLVTAIVLNFRSPRATVQCVQEMLQQKANGEVEILVVDNHSDDDSIGILRAQLPKAPNIRIIETPRNKGFGSGYNTAARLARGTFLLVNNPTKRLEPDALQKMIDRMEADPTIGIIGPKMIHADGSRRLSMRRDPRPIDIIARRSVLGTLFPKALHRYLMLDSDADALQEVDWVVGGSFLMRRDLFLKLHGFDERFFLFFEDADLCRRCRALGKKVVYDPSPVARDKRRRLSGETFWDLLFSRTGRIHVISALRYFGKWGMTVSLDPPKRLP